MREVPVSIKCITLADIPIIFDYDAPFDRDGIKRRFVKPKETFTLFLKTDKSERIPENTMNSGITASWFTALNCFCIQQYPAAILFSIISIESLLNRDSRMYKEKGDKSWISLIPALKMAQRVGIDVSDLQDPDGTFDTIRTRRNKIAHGEFDAYFEFLNKGESLSDLAKMNISEEEFTERAKEKLSITENQALDQIQRTFNFIRKWAESKPRIVINELR